MVHTLTGEGRIIVHYGHDILFVVPKFADYFLVQRCGIAEKPVDSKELMARVSVAGKLRAFNKATEDLFNGYAAPFNMVYPRVSSSDKEAWASITVAEAAKHLNAHHRDRSLVLHAVYSRLMKHSHTFVMDNRNFISSQTFYVRPRSQVGRFNQVWRLMHNDNDRVMEFVLRAKEIIFGLRKMTEDSKNRVPSYNSASDFAFTEDDQLFIKFFLDSLVDVRAIQANPYTPLICEIMKSLGLYRGDVDSEQVRQFLVDLGVLSPWQDIPSLIKVQPAFMTPTPDPAPLLKGKQVSKSAASTSSLGPDEFYPADLLESIRHDFGQLPVYTVDDNGAQELDDGISIERDTADPSKLWIHVHVADPTAILPPTHSLARRARDFVHTFYFNHSSRGMLPESLVKDKLSLGNAAGTGRAENVMTFSAKIDPSGDIVDYRVRPGIIRNVRILRYDDVDAAMSLPSHALTFPFGRPTKSLSTPLNLSPADIDNLHLLDLFSKRTVARRLGTSSFVYGLGRPELDVSPKPLPVGVVDLIQPGLFLGNPRILYAVRNARPSGSRQIVAEAAQVANRVASRFGRDHGVPLVWRSLAAPVGSDEALADLLRSRDEDGWVDFFEVRRKGIQLQSSRYTLEPAKHWMLGIAESEGYTRATSPLRRYGDLVTHWQIKHMLLHNKPLFSSKEMQTTFDHISGKEERWKNIQQAHDRWWALAFIKRRMMESKSESGDYDPIENMIGQVAARARLDSFRGTWVQEVHIASLGLFGILEADSEREIGTEVAVTVDKIMLTSHPALRLKLARS